jgi:general stress protein 26
MQRNRLQESDDGQTLARLRQMIGKARVAMLTTISDDQELRSRPLHTEHMDDDGTLWFIVGAATAKLREIYAHGGKVCLSYVDLERDHYVSLTGTAHLVDDPGRKAALWSATAEIWFPGGKDDASVGVLKCIPERGEYWDGPATAAGRVLAFARAATTGDVSGFGTTRKFQLDAGARPADGT